MSPQSIIVQIIPANLSYIIRNYNIFLIYAARMIGIIFLLISLGMHIFSGAEYINLPDDYRVTSIQHADP